MLWVWPRPAAVALIGPLAWELPYAALVTLKEREKERERERNSSSIIYLSVATDIFL